VQVVCVKNATHGYAFWEGMNEEDKCHAGRIFVASDMRAIAVIQRAFKKGCDPVAQMRDWGFGPLRLAWDQSVAQSGACCP
jgi:hypothetical protein